MTTCLCTGPGPSGKCKCQEIAESEIKDNPLYSVIHESEGLMIYKNNIIHPRKIKTQIPIQYIPH